MDLEAFVDNSGVHSGHPFSKVFTTAAVLVESLSKSYGKEATVLSNVYMKVDQGSIYTLLGSSGCGKTTLLNCIVGLRKCSSGSILVLGSNVNGPQGRNVGYMPQEIALHEDLSIKETIEYFGRLYGLPKHEISEQRKWVTNFLQLPSTFKLVKDCSGGMKRRVSMAVALSHNPKLLVLDEPTVGLDPLLRESIWTYLHQISATGRTVLITTHYIEEARNSRKIGIMRDGQILLEESPNLLLSRYGCTLLQDCMLEIFKEAKRGIKLGGSKDAWKNCTKNATIPYGVPEKENTDRIKVLPETKNKNGSTVYGRVSAFSLVIWLQFFRHPLFLVAILLLPTSQIVLSFLVVGTTPKDIQFGIIHHDAIQYESCRQSSPFLDSDQPSCDSQLTSCSVVRHLSQSKTLKLINVESEDIARAKVAEGNLWGYFSFPNNYSTHLADLAMTKAFASNETLEGSQIHITMDMSHQLVTKFVTHDIYSNYLSFFKEIAIACGSNENEHQLPIQWRDPVYGSYELNYGEYFIPLVLLAVVTEIPMLLTALLYVSDIQLGTLNRARLAGVNFFEVMISYWITVGSIIIVQTIVFSAIVYMIWGLQIKGQYWLYGFIFLIGGMGGGSSGLFFGVATENEIDSLLIATWWAIFVMTNSGLYWPLEGLSSWIKWVTQAMPAAAPVESLRSVMYRGFGISDGIVLVGILKSVRWTVMWVVFSLIVFLVKQKRK